MSALKWLAKDADDLGIVAAALQDAILRVGEISYASQARSVSLRLWRYSHERQASELSLIHISEPTRPY